MFKLAVMFFEFFKIGLFAVGGGLATIPFLNDLASKTGWYTISQLSTMIAVSESTPGAMGVNMATYVGFVQEGVVGGIVVTLGLVAPSIIVICLIAKMYDQFKRAKIVQEIFSGLKPAVVAFISCATLDIIVSAIFGGEFSVFTLNVKACLLLVGLFTLKYFNKNLHPIWFILIAAVFGVILGL